MCKHGQMLTPAHKIMTLINKQMLKKLLFWPPQLMPALFFVLGKHPNPRPPFSSLSTLRSTPLYLLILLQGHAWVHMVACFCKSNKVREKRKSLWTFQTQLSARSLQLGRLCRPSLFCFLKQPGEGFPSFGSGSQVDRGGRVLVSGTEDYTMAAFWKEVLSASRVSSLLLTIHHRKTVCFFLLCFVFQSR